MEWELCHFREDCDVSPGENCSTAPGGWQLTSVFLLSHAGLRYMDKSWDSKGNTGN